MASISKEPNGRRTIQFVGSDGKRRSIRLGKVSQRDAEAVKFRVECLVAAGITGRLDPETARWVAGLDQGTADKLAAVGLIPKRASATLESFLAEYVTGRIDVKPSTKTAWWQVQRDLLEHFGGARELASITPGEADGFKLYLIGRGLAQTTVHKRLQFARQVFRAMVRHKLIPANPFADVKACAAADTARQRFITPVRAITVIEGTSIEVIEGMRV